MAAVEAHKVVIVKPGAGHQWQVSLNGQATVMSFTARQLAIDFGRAYARLRRRYFCFMCSTRTVFSNTKKNSAQTPNK